MDKEEYDETIRLLRTGTDKEIQIALRIEQLEQKLAIMKRALEACEGSLRNSGNMVRDLNDECLRLQEELAKLAK